MPKKLIFQSGWAGKGTDIAVPVQKAHGKTNTGAHVGPNLKCLEWASVRRVLLVDGSLWAYSLLHFSRVVNF